VSGGIRLQHALLSALRNLAIPAENKSILLKDGLVATVLPMMEVPTFPVVFKLLGTLRMAIDGQGTLSYINYILNIDCLLTSNLQKVQQLSWAKTAYC